MKTEEKIIKNPYGFIYITTNTINGKRYLGQKKFDNDSKWENYIGSGTAFTRALKKYGKENFSRNIICLCYSEDELNKAEYDLSVFLNVVEDSGWYNLCYGGGVTNGYHHSEEAKKKISKKNSIPSKETRKKMSESAKARCTDEWKKWLSNRQKGKWTGENNPKYNNHFWSGKNNPRHVNPLIGKDNGRAKKVVQLTKDLQFIKIWDCISDAARYLNGDNSNIINCCKYKIPSAYGYKWMYEYDYEQFLKNKK